MLLCAILLGTVVLTEGDLVAIREMALRESLQDSGDLSFFVAYCISEVPGTTGPAKSREERVSLVSHGARVDSTLEFLNRFKDLQQRLLPGSSCGKTSGEYEVVEKATKRGPAIILEWGPVEVISSNHVVITERSDSGFLTETFTEYELRRGKDGRWSVVGSRILLQASGDNIERRWRTSG